MPPTDRWRLTLAGTRTVTAWAEGRSGNGVTVSSFSAATSPFDRTAPALLRQPRERHDVQRLAARTRVDTGGTQRLLCCRRRARPAAQCGAERLPPLTERRVDNREDLLPRR